MGMSTSAVSVRGARAVAHSSHLKSNGKLEHGSSILTTRQQFKIKYKTAKSPARV